MTSTSEHERWEGRLLPVAAIAAAALVVVLGLQNRTLKAEIAELRARVETLQGLAASVGPGDALPALSLEDLEGRAALLTTLLPDGGVVAFFTTTCPACRETLPSWGEIASAYAAREVPFVGVSLHRQPETDAYVREHGIDWPVWVLSEEALSGPPPPIGGVPLTVMVGADGAVAGAWMGLLHEAERDSLLTALDSEPAWSNRVLSGSPAGDPGCCDNLASDGTDARR